MTSRVARGWRVLLASPFSRSAYCDQSLVAVARERDAVFPRLCTLALSERGGSAHVYVDPPTAVVRFDQHAANSHGPGNFRQCRETETVRRAGSVR